MAAKAIDLRRALAEVENNVRHMSIPRLGGGSNQLSVTDSSPSSLKPFSQRRS